MGSSHDGTTEQTAIWQFNKNNPIGGSCTAVDRSVKSNSTTGAFDHQSPTTRMTRTTQNNNNRAINHPTKTKWPPRPGPPSQHLQMTHTPHRLFNLRPSQCRSPHFRHNQPSSIGLLHHNQDHRYNTPQLRQEIIHTVSTQHHCKKGEIRLTRQGRQGRHHKQNTFLPWPLRLQLLPKSH